MRLVLFLGVLIASAIPGHAADADGDGVQDVNDCAPADPRVATPHTYFFDLDGDQFGSAQGAFSLCAINPFPGSLVWGDDPDDANNRVLAPIVAKGARQLGLDFARGPASGQWRVDLARELGADLTTLRLTWSGIETGAGDFSGPEGFALFVADAAYPSQGFAVSLSISPISGRSLALPADLAAGIVSGARRFSDPAVIERFKQFLGIVRAGMPQVSVASLQIGDDLDEFAAVAPDAGFWDDYAVFLAAVRDHARQLWGAGLPVGFTATQPGLVAAPTRSAMQKLAAVADFVGVSYRPQAGGFIAVPPLQVAQDLDPLLALYAPKPLRFLDVAYPSAVAAHSSTTQQSQFLHAFFSYWDRHAERIPLVVFGALHDMAPAEAAAQAAARGLSGDLAARATAYFASLGVRTADGDGIGKSAYGSLRNLAVERGWWRPLASASRNYLLGFTPFPYDQVPGTMPSAAVLDSVFAPLRASADLVALHFDKGVPWVEAAADTLASPLPPYSANVLATWEQYRSRKPPGAVVAVSINPLGIPRSRTAAYWGIGQSYYLDANNNQVANGPLIDFEDRVLPPPWDGYAVNSPEVKAAFVKYAKRVIGYFRPDYLITGLEVNLALDHDTRQFANYLDLQRHVYQALKADPATAAVRVVVSVTAEDLIDDEFGTPYLIQNMQDTTRMARHRQALREIAPHCDAIGLAVYPVKSRFGANRLPATTFTRLLSTVHGLVDKPVVITETGFPAAAFTAGGLPFPASPELQARFVRLLLDAAEKDGRVEFVNQFGPRDITAYMDRLRAGSLQDPPTISAALVDFFQYFEYIGLYDGAGQARPALQAWQGEYEQPVAAATPWIEPVALASPLGRLVATLRVDGQGSLVLGLSRDGVEVIDDSPLGITVDGVALGTNVVNLAPGATKASNSNYRTRGSHIWGRNHFHETTVTVRRSGSGDSAWDLVLRLYDDGLAYRYVVPGSGTRMITGEASGWRLKPGSIVWHQVNTDNYESSLRHWSIGSFGDEIGAPVTVELPGGGFLALTEGRARDYSGMTLRADLASTLLRARFLDDAAWPVLGGSMSPWRIAIASADLGGLVRSDLVANTADPPDTALFPEGPETGWIRPGRAVWSWWSEPTSGFLYDVQRQYIDHAAALGYEYVVVDAWWELGFPAFGQDQFARLAELVAYGRSGGRQVGVWVWKAWFELIDPAARQLFLQRVKAAGAVGVKVDNIFAQDSESQASLRLTEQILRDAAALQLMVNFHGIPKPSGLSRTYPNEITREGLQGMELNGLAWAQGGFLAPEHNAALPFVRYLAGPGDATPVTFDPRKLGNTTFAHQLATAGLLPSPLLHLAEDPQRVLAQTDLLDLLKAIPGEWDETRVLADSRIGRLAALARRSGERWFVFVVSGDAAAAQEIAALDLSFLAAGSYDAVLIRDAARTQVAREELRGVTAAARPAVQLLPGGGFVAMFTPVAPTRRSFRMGFTAQPPENTRAGYETIYTVLRHAADMVAHSLQEGVPWGPALASADYRNYPASLRATWEAMRAGDAAVVPGHARYLMLNPIAISYDGLAPNWSDFSNQPLPEPWAGYEFNHPDVMQAFLNYTIAAIEFFRPTHVALNVEANILLARRPLRWAAFKELNAFLYGQVKARYPDLKVFSTVHYEHLLGRHADSAELARSLQGVYPGVLEAEVVSLLAHSDLLALSSYPFMVVDNPVGQDYFARALAVGRAAGRRLAFDQVGYASRDIFFAPLNVTLPGSPHLQQDFMATVLRTAADNDFEFVVNFVGADYGTNFGSDPTTLTWAFTGLVGQDGRLKPALDVWGRYLALPRF